MSDRDATDLSAGWATRLTHTHTHSSLRYMLLMWQATCSVKGLNEFQTLNETRAPSCWSMFGRHDVAQTVAN